MKNIFRNGLIIAAATSMIACGGGIDVEPTLKKTSWTSEDGTKTLEFTKKEVLMDGVTIYEGNGEVKVEEGQIWVEDGENKTYMFDYKISGQNLFVATETTSDWNDPSSPAVVSEKYKQN